MKGVVHLLTIFSLFTLSACTHIKVVAFDKRQNTVTIQGGKWASDDDYQKAADEYCQGAATLLAMNENTVGSYTSASAQSYGNSASGSAITMGIRRYNKLFSCDSIGGTPVKPPAK